MNSQIDLPYNIRPLQSKDSVRLFLIENKTKTDLDLTCFLLVPVNARNNKPTISTDYKIVERSVDSGTFTRLSIELHDFKKADFVVVLVELKNAYRVNMQDNLPVGARIDQRDPARLEAFLAKSSWRSFAIPVPKASDSYALLFSSCQYPGDLFRREPPKATLVRALNTLEKDAYCKSSPYLLIAGDGVYVDPTAGLFEPKTEHEIFSVAYETQARSDAWQELLIKMHGTSFAIDDHELTDNWEPSENPLVTAALKAKLTRGRKWFLEQRYGEKDTGQPLWSEQNLGEIPLFIMDTRTERTLRTPHNHRTVPMISQTQMCALKRWLLTSENRPGFRSAPKIILSPAMILPRSLRTAERTQNVTCLHNETQSENTAVALASDSWDGYPQTMGEVLGFIAQHRIHNVIFLSGDEHISCYAKAEITAAAHDEPITIHSIHASPLYGPYPFANARPSDFAASETFVQPFLDEHKCANAVSISVSADLHYVGDAFGLLQITNCRADQWDVAVTLCVAGKEDIRIQLS